MTDALNEFADEFDWSRDDLKQVVRFLQPLQSLLIQWRLQPTASVVSLSCLPDVPHSVHPIPVGSADQGLVELWADEVGKLYAIHELTCPEPDRYYIGIACDYAFAGECQNRYDDQGTIEAFPLVGPSTLHVLISAYEPIVPPGIRARSVSIAQAYKNLPKLGAIKIDAPSGGSHYKVHFPDAPRPWILDPNNDPVPEPYLRELTPLTGRSLEEIIYVLTTGKTPKYRLRLLNLKRNGTKIGHS